jgi:hypothetical protein
MKKEQLIKGLQKVLAAWKKKENVVTVYYSSSDYASVLEKSNQAAKKYGGMRVGVRGENDIAMCDYEFSDLENIPKFKEEMKRIIGFGFVA